MSGNEQTTSVKGKQKKRCKSDGQLNFLHKTMMSVMALSHIYVWGISIGILTIIILYITSQLGKKEKNISNMNFLYNDDNLNKYPQINSIFGSDDKIVSNDFKLDLITNKGKLADYMISSSYNSCCSGDFLDSYVSLDALKNVIHQGVRVLDFSIYLVKENGKSKAVVGAAPDSSTNIKGTYNYLNLGTPPASRKEEQNKGVFETIKNEAMMGVLTGEKRRTCTNTKDPLFIHLRIMSAQSEKIYKSLAEQFDEVWSEGDMQIFIKPEQDQLGEVPLNKLNNKIVIIISDPNVNHWREVNDKNWEDGGGELVLGKNDKIKKFMKKVSSFSDYQHRSDHMVKINKTNAQSSDVKAITGLTRKKIYIIIPDELSINDNMNYEIHHNMGCQMVCMNWQNLDGPLETYREKFMYQKMQTDPPSKTTKHFAFILKSKSLRGNSITLTPASKLPDNTSTAPQTQIMYGTTMNL
tara:strand:- start:1011 stop:2411 length:1401 start_codon:yes stop_codon:yes gene_type:complete